MKYMATVALILMSSIGLVAAPKDPSSGVSNGTNAAENRLDKAAKVLDELLSAKDKGIPDDVFKSAKCVAVVPSMLEGGFIFGAEHGKAVATCRTAQGWSAPAFFTITGGSWGAQIGGEAVDMVMLFMNDEGAKRLLDADFKLGGDASVAAGPVGREVSANTDWKLNTDVLTYSRARGVFVGINLNGAVVRQDANSTAAVYGQKVDFRQILSGQVPTPPDSSVQRFISTVRQEKAQVAAR
jgi:lipid-binding SYLF domain-containing protein